MKADAHVKTLVVQKLNRALIPCVYADQVLNDKQYKRGDVIDIIPGRYAPGSQIMKHMDWCAIVVPAGVSKALRLKLLYSATSATRSREYALDLDALGIEPTAGFEIVDRTEQALAAAVIAKPIEKRPWIIGA